MLAFIKALIVVALMALLAACSNDIENLELHSTSGLVNLAEQVPGDWHRICIFTPYTTNSKCEEISGVSSHAINATDIPYSDSFVVLGVLYADEQYELYRVSMASVVFVNNKPECFARDEAVLQTR